MQFNRLRRREFFTLASGAAAWPLAARAQPTSPTIGFLHGATANAYALLTTAFLKSVSESGDVTIEYRWAEGRLERLSELAADLVRRQVTVIFAGGGSEPALAAKAATSEIPIVFANGVDPVEVGLVESLNRPGINVTGITFLVNTLGPKELEILHELQPTAGAIAVLLNPDLATAGLQSKDMEETARALGLKIHIFHARTEREIDTAFASLTYMKVGGLVIGANAFFFSQRDQLVRLAAHYSVPTVYPWREAVIAGGLASYGSDPTDAYRRAGIYTARILKGEKPAELPVQQSTKTEFIINLKTARALRLDISPTLSARADEVIE
jgi:putative ABC transport system substrate-binding protein